MSLNRIRNSKQGRKGEGRSNLIRSADFVYGKSKKFFSDINKSKFKSLYVKNFLFAVSILIVVLFAAITFNDIWLNIIGIFVLFGFSYLTFNVRAIEQNKLYEEVTGVITGYKEKAKADVLTPRLISEECSFIVETDNEKLTRFYFHD